MAVGAHQYLSRPDIAVLGQDLVADAANIAADVVKLGNALVPDEVPHLLLVRGGLGRLGRHAMIKDDRDTVRIPDVRLPAGIAEDLVELVDDQRRVLV